MGAFDMRIQITLFWIACTAAGMRTCHCVGCRPEIIWFEFLKLKYYPSSVKIFNSYSFSAISSVSITSTISTVSKVLTCIINDVWCASVSTLDSNFDGVSYNLWIGINCRMFKNIMEHKNLNFRTDWLYHVQFARLQSLQYLQHQSQLEHQL